MKKLSIALILLSFLGLNAQADVSFGVKLSSAEMTAQGSETQNSGALVTQQERSADFEVASLFAEKSVELGAVDLALGLEIIPFTAEIAKIGGGTGFDFTASVGNLTTAYIQPMLISRGAASLYVKAGYANADLEISNISRQATSSATTDSASTDAAQSRDLEGPMYGVGIQVEMDAFVDSIRIEMTRHDFDNIRYVNSNNKILKADTEMDTFSLGIVKSF